MNRKKNILIISPFFYPEPISTGKFNTNVAESLSEKGHQITVLCFHPFYPEWKVKQTNKSLKNIKIIRGGKRLFYPKNNFLRRIVLEFGFSFFLLRKLRKHQKEIDVVIPVFPPSLGFYCISFFLNKRIKAVGMVHDLQEVYSSAKKGIVNKFVNFWIKRVEKKCFNSCDKLIFLSNEMKNEAQRVYKLNAEKLEVQYPFITLTNQKTNDLSRILKSDVVNVVYSGALGEKQNPKELYDFFKYASSKTMNIIFHFFSQGKNFNQLEKANTNKKIRFHNLVATETLNELYAKSDVQILPQLPNTSKGSLPSKLPNLLTSGCKILVITDKNSEIENLFKSKDLIKVTTSWEKESLLNNLEELIRVKNNKQHQIEVANELFTIDKMIDKILN